MLFFPKIRDIFKYNINKNNVFKQYFIFRQFSDLITNEESNQQKRSNSIIFSNDKYQNKFLTIIYEDDIRRLQNFISDYPTFDIQHHINISKEPISSFFKTQVISYLDFSCFVGSVKCFNFFLLITVQLPNQQDLLLFLVVMKQSLVC